MSNTKFKDVLALLGEQATKDIAAGEEIVDVFIKYRTQVVERVHVESNGNSWPNVVNDIAFLLFMGTVAEDQRGESCDVRDTLRNAFDISLEAHDSLLNVVKQKEARASNNAKKSAEAGHSQPNGSRDKRAKIISIWKSGKYKTKTKCAEMEHDKIGMSFSTASKALREPKAK